MSLLTSPSHTPHAHCLFSIIFVQEQSVVQLPAVGIAAELKRRPHVLIADQSYVSQVCCSVLQCVAMCCSVFQCVALRRLSHVSESLSSHRRSELFLAGESVAVCCGVLQCVAVCCSVLQCVAVCCSVLQCVAVCSELCLAGEMTRRRPFRYLYLQSHTHAHTHTPYATSTYSHTHTHTHTHLTLSLPTV